MLLFKKIMQRHKLALIGILVVLGVVLLVAIGDIPFFIDKISRGSFSIRENIISIAKVAIPLKDRILRQTVDDKLARIQSTGACKFCDLNQSNMEGMDLIGIDLRYANLARANLYGTNLTGANLRGTNLSGVELFGSNFSGVDLSGKDLTGSNLSGVDLSGKDLSGTILVQANLSGTNLSGVDLTGANLKGAFQFDIHIKKSRDLSISNVTNETGWDQVEGVTSFDLSGNVQYLTTKNGLLYELKNEESTIALNLVNDAQFPFHDKGEGGLLSVVSNNKFVYISYTSEGYLVVDEYSKNFSNVRNIIKISGKGNHYGGNLVFDKIGMLYLSVGDDGNMYLPQNLKSLRGKILRLDVSKLKLDPVIVAYGLRNPWKVSIDSKNRMFIGDCGDTTVESVYLLNDLYSVNPYNLGWPVFEGTKRNKGDPLMFKDTLAPIYEYERSGRPGCSIGGYYLDHLEVYLFGDLFGTLWLLKEQNNGKWYLYHEDKPVNIIWTFGYDEKTKKIFIGPNNFELIISMEPFKLESQAKLCRTTMPNGSINNSGCQ